MDKIDPLVSHTSCGLGILNGSGQIIYSNMILDQPSNTAQPSSADSSSSTVGKPGMLSKQFDTAYTTEEQRKSGTSRYRRELVYPFSLGQPVPPKLSLFCLSLYNSRMGHSHPSTGYHKAEIPDIPFWDLVIAFWKWSDRV
ncbi:hypothetical protein CDL15_Pgr022128 [Punica granatum]|uniref:Uncharacterized protein n=1 Tax=Punica granatum TaxID=22663 RepID=A0A218VSS1_PUNGR|nr:hypothetical protein CDL15_Pgr022128 [Punica granatum]